jgi:hypothetical protein
VRVLQAQVLQIELGLCNVVWLCCAVWIVLSIIALPGKGGLGASCTLQFRC